MTTEYEQASEGVGAALVKAEDALNTAILAYERLLELEQRVIDSAHHELLRMAQQGQDPNDAQPVMVESGKALRGRERARMGLAVLRALGSCGDDDV